MTDTHVIDLPAGACPRCRTAVPGEAAACHQCGADRERDAVLDAWVRARIGTAGKESRA